jgi:hypothetical protein
MNIREFGREHPLLSSFVGSVLGTLFVQAIENISKVSKFIATLAASIPMNRDILSISFALLLGVLFFTLLYNLLRTRKLSVQSAPLEPAVKTTETRTEVPVKAKAWLSEEETMRELVKEFSSFLDESAADSPLSKLREEGWNQRMMVKRAEIAMELVDVRYLMDDYENRSKLLMRWCDELDEELPIIRGTWTSNTLKCKRINNACDEVHNWLDGFHEKVEQAIQHFGWEKRKDESE